MRNIAFTCSVFLLFACSTGPTVKEDPPPALPEQPPAGPKALVYVSGGSDQISIFSLDLATGALAKKGAATAGNRPTYMAFSPDRKRLYGVGGDRVIAFSVDRGTGELVQIGSEIPTGGEGAPHVAVDPSGRWVLVPHFRSWVLSVLPVLPDGTVGAPVDSLKTSPEAHQAVTDPTGSFVFVPCRRAGGILKFRLDPATGKLTRNDPPSIPSQSRTAGPRHLAFHPTGKWAYVINETEGTMTSYVHDPAKGILSEPQVSPTVPDGFIEKAAAHVAVHPTGRFVYGSNRLHNSIVIYAVDQGTGRLRLSGFEQADGLIRTPRNFTLDQTGTFLLVANHGAGTLLVLRIDPADGRLTRVGEPVDGLGEPAWVGVLPPS
jgi:6-phosphogluconolactonase